MWASYPIENEIIGNGNVLESTEIIISGGNSGGPWFSYNVVVENGIPVKYASIVGIAVASSRDLAGNEIRSYACRVRPIIINLYNHLI